MPAFTGDVTNSAGSLTTTIAAGVVTNAKLAVAGSANTIKGAATSTSIADLAVPSCSAGSNALQWVTGTGFQCGTLGATSAGWGVAISGGGVISIATTQPPYGFDVPVNLGLTASASGSALTINVVGANGSAPSATNPVSVPFRSTTLATGTPNWTAITSALSIIVPSAATLGTSNSVPFRVWIFLAYNGGTPEMGVAICSVSTTIYPCTAWEFTRTTTTTISGFATSAGTLYATTGVSNDAVRIIGYCEYASGLATAGSWASACTTFQVLGPGINKPGNSVQIVSPVFGTLTAVTFTTSPTSTNITAAIVPTSPVNLVKYYASTSITNSNTASSANAQMYRGSTAIGALLKTSPGGSGSFGASLTLVGIDAPQATSSQTYVVKGVAPTNTGSIPAVNTDSATEILEEIMGELDYPANDNGSFDQRMVG